MPIHWLSEDRLGKLHFGFTYTDLWTSLLYFWTKLFVWIKVKGKVQSCTGTEALYRPYGS